MRAVRCSQLGNERELTLCAPLFVDATGDGTLAALAGAEWRMGREARGEFGEPKAPEAADKVTQGSTIQFRARDIGRPVPFVAPDWAIPYPTEDSLYCRGHDNPAGGYWWIEIGSPFDTLADNEAIRHELLRHVLGVFDHIKNRGEHGAANMTLDWVGPVPGKRETRRVVGPVILTENDLRSRRLWPDRVCHGGWFLDEHVPGGLLAAGSKPEESAYDFDIKDRQQVGPYAIPLRALRCRDVANLFLAGRDLSATHIALASARVMGTCAVMGQAVGAAAAICRRRNRRPDELADKDIAAIQQLLLKEDHYVPFVRNEDPADLARSARVTADSSAELCLPAGPTDRWLELTYPTMQIVPLTADRLDAVELLLDNRAGRPVEMVLHVFARRDIWDFSNSVMPGSPESPSRKTSGLPVSRVLVNPGSGWRRFELNRRIEPGLYGIAVEGCPGVFWSRRPPPESPPPGTAVATFRRSGCWRFSGLRGQWPAMAVRVFPSSRPYEPPNVINGVARPEVWPNLWISAPAAGLPQSLTLRWAETQTVAEVRLTFDNNLGRNIRGTPGNFVAPELVRDYRVELHAGKWETAVEVADNRRRHRVHRFEPRPADAVRLTVLATNGVAEARVYEVRILGPGV